MVGCWLPGWLRLELGLSCAWGWARPVSDTLGPEAGWRVAGWAGPGQSQTRKTRQQGLRPVSDCAEGAARREQAWPAGAELLGQPD